jgi:hypothetical protein
MKGLSLKQKMVLASSGVFLVISMGSAVFFSELWQAKDRTERSFKVLSSLEKAEEAFNKMTIGMRGFLLDSSRLKEWESKLKADEMANEAFKAARAASFNPEVSNLLEEAAKFDEVMDRLENEFGELVKNSTREQAEGFYFQKYLPVRGKMEALVEKARTMARSDETSFEQKHENVIKMGGAAFLLITFASLVFSFFFNQRIASKVTGSIEKLADQLSNSVVSIEAASRNTASASQQIATSATENASAITETLSISDSGKKESDRGKEVVTQMNEAMNEVFEANSRLEQLIKVIEDIQGKTKMINDIVFETRLLSFNASIEAARAGTHGKGFAVVAEEVGKLASVSGKAAEEINSLLANSTYQVKEIVSNTSQRIQSARTISLQCEQVFQQMNHSMSEINRAMIEMEKETHQNSASAEEMANQAQTLALESKSLGGLLKRLNLVISGDNDRAVAAPSVVSSGSMDDSVHRGKVVPIRSHETSVASYVGPSDTVDGADPVVDRGDQRWKAS